MIFDPAFYESIGGGTWEAFGFGAAFQFRTAEQLQALQAAAGRRVSK
jgi:hypothetical protein